jgi:hypothetical protein
MKTKRKIIQISSCCIFIPETEYVAEFKTQLFGLADDGTVWLYTEGEWIELPELPERGTI